MKQDPRNELIKATDIIRRVGPQLGRAIESVRKERAVTAQKLAKEIGVSVPTLDRIERGELLDTLLIRRLITWAEREAKERGA